MRTIPILSVAAILTACTSAPYALRDMGSFHVGGRDVEITGKPVKEGGVHAGRRSGEGGFVEILDLPNAGIRGNSHMLMMDRNNLQVAALIQQWLEKQGLVR